MLESLHLCIDEVLDDLHSIWVRSKGYKYNDTAFTKRKYSGSNIMVCCPHHYEINPSFGISTEFPYYWSCFGCGAKGNLEQLFAHVLQVDELKAMRYVLKNYAAVSVTDRKPINLDKIFNDKLVSYNPVPEEAILEYRKKRHSYLYNRGFCDRTLDKYEVGYDSQKNALTFPVRDSNGFPRFIKRRFVDRKIFLNKSNVPKKDIIYGLHYIIKSGRQIEEIYLNESEIDTMSCYEGLLPAGATLGRILFKEQVKELLKYGIKRVNLFYDNDEWGLKGMINAYKLLKETPIKVGIVVYPEGEEKDANDLLVNNRLDRISVVNPLDFLSNLLLH